MTVVENLKSCLTKPNEMQTKTRKSIYRNTRGTIPLYDPDALPERTMQFLREFKGFETEEAKRKPKVEEFDVHEAQYVVWKILQANDKGRATLMNRMQDVEQTFMQHTDTNGAFLASANPECCVDQTDS